MLQKPERRPALQVFFDETSLQGRIVPDSDLDGAIWTRVVQTARVYDPELTVRSSEILLQWHAAVATLQDVATLRKTHGFSIVANGVAEELLKRAKSERMMVRAARQTDVVELSADQVRNQLIERGWAWEKRALRDFQVRDLSILRALHHGANFSVPGSGKTTVSLALHLLTRDADTHLLVVCPKNAIAAWIEVVDECMRSEAPDGNAERFVRLDGDDDSIMHLLRSGRRRFVITYDRAIRLQSILRDYLSTHPVHMILDESHRIKAGSLSQRGRVLGQLAPLPVRRDILSGTPLPKGVEDLGPQVDFLWPGLGLSRRIEAQGTAKGVIRNLYVRTTKRDLHLPERRIQFENVTMGPAQTALYAAIKSPVIRQLQKIKNTHRITIAARNNVMRLLEVSSNPVLAVRAMGASYAPPVDPADALCNAVIDEGDSNKMLRACEIARALAEKKRKCVIWALFHENVDRMLFLLEDLGAINIDGRVPSGDPDDFATREGRIAAFHNDPQRMVLLANPAACSEGINLHHAAHDAIYLERSYNAAHYLQSLDRIHRLGLREGVITNVTILQSIAPARVGSIDHSVGVRMRAKLRAMYEALEDEDLRQLLLDEESAEPPVDVDESLEDLSDLLDQLLTGRLPSDNEQD